MGPELFAQYLHSALIVMGIWLGAGLVVCAAFCLLVRR